MRAYHDPRTLWQLVGRAYHMKPLFFKTAYNIIIVYELAERVRAACLKESLRHIDRAAHAEAEARAFGCYDSVHAKPPNLLPVLSAIRRQTSAMLCSSVFPLVSRITASSAAFNGAAARSVSCSSRCFISARTSTTHRQCLHPRGVQGQQPFRFGTSLQQHAFRGRSSPFCFRVFRPDRQDC